MANLACSISNNEEGVKLVRMAATQIDSLCPQVSLIHFVSTADILDLVHSSLHVTHSLPCPFSSPWKVLPISHGPFQVLPFSKRTANCSSLSKITVVIFVFCSLLNLEGVLTGGHTVLKGDYFEQVKLWPRLCCEIFSFW